MHSKIIYFVLAFFGFIYTYSLFPVFSTGDGGGLITASYLLGIAHPPGYPFYLQISKIFTFLPNGNIGIRIGLLSVFFSVLSLFILYKITLKLTNKPILSITPLLFLGVSYSYYFNSVVEKFYTLNLSIILLLFFIGMKQILFDKLDKRDVLFSAFILGLATSIHHTALFMTVPLILVGLFYYRDFLKVIPHSIFMFLLGFSVNIYLYIRSLKDSFSAAHKADNLDRFIAIILRKFYGSSSSLDAPISAIATFDGFYHSIKNLFTLTVANLTYGSILLSILGLYYLYKLNKKLLLFFVLTLFMYGFFLAKITLSSKYNLSTAYVSANQYFLPFLSFICITISLGVVYIVDLLKKLQLITASRTFVFSIMVIPFTTLPLTFISTNHKKNWVPYYHSKGLLSIMPVSSLVSTYGDNHTFELWYLKLVGRYRDDVCHITTHYYNTLSWRVEGCKPKQLYKPLIPEFFNGELVSLSEKNKFLSTVALSKEHPLSAIFYHQPYEFIFFYKEKNKKDQEIQFFDKLNQEKFKFLTPEVCLTHETDDPFTIEMCNFFSNSYLVVASTIKPVFLLNSQKLTIDADISYGKFVAPFKLEIYINPLNASYIEMYKAIRAYNKREFYLYEEDR
ncbi:MAG: DUF2723 domain-containing protein [Hydrogenothermaceae bacterium]|nr:DUF2723 domain-containing protein [Hydrogenothermaceae bacterium]